MKTEQGFTLIELMVTLAVAAILVTIAVPGFRSIIQSNRATTEANNLLTAMTLARSEAIKAAENTTVCASANQSTCAVSTNWSTGYIVFIDADNSGQFNDDGDATLCESTNNVYTEDCLLRVFDAPQGNMALTQTAGGNNVRYTSTGLATGTAYFTLTMPDTTINQMHYVCVSPTGRAIAKDTVCP